MPDPDEPSIAAAGASPGRRKTAAPEPRRAPETDQLGRVNREQRGGRRSRAKGDRIEREIVSRHAAIGIKAERYPLSGASRFRGSGHDVDIYAFGTNEAPLVGEVKKRKGGAGFVTLESWLGQYDALFLRRNNADPLVLVPWRIWARLLERVQR